MDWTYVKVNDWRKKNKSQIVEIFQKLSLTLDKCEFIFPVLVSLSCYNKNVISDMRN